MIKVSENYSHTTFESGYLLADTPYPYVIEYYEDEGWGEVRRFISNKNGLLEDAVQKAKSAEVVLLV